MPCRARDLFAEPEASPRVTWLACEMVAQDEVGVYVNRSGYIPHVEQIVRAVSAFGVAKIEMINAGAVAD